MTLCAERGLPHLWISSVTDREEHCLYCTAKKPHVDWKQPLEPGPVKLVPHSEERARAQNDADTTGIGFLVDLKRVEPCRVVMLGPQRLPPAIDAEAIARIIIGPREPVPADSRYSLRELQDIRWEDATLQERNNALWIGNVVMKLLEGNT